MTQILLILLGAALLARDQFSAPALHGALGAGWVIAITLGGHALIGAFALVAALLAGRRLARTGDPAAFVLAGGVQTASQWGTVLWHVVAVLGLGWLDAVRAFVGDWIGIDEALAMVPALLVFAAGWWGMAPIDLLLRQSRIMRALDNGEVVYPPPSAVQFVLLQARTQLAMMFAPMLVLMAWTELVGRGVGYLEARARGMQMLRDSSLDRLAAWVHDAGAGDALRTGAQVAGVAAVFCFMPLVMRRLWDTVALPVEGLRARLLELCAVHGVRVRDVLVWRTHGSLANGVVMGLLGRWRYIMLSDALLDSLDEDEILAVMAHEVGHVRRRHMLWLAGALMACTGAGAVGVAMAGRWAIMTAAPEWTSAWSDGRGPMMLVEALVEGVLSLAGLTLGLCAFGWVARRFEWQADAFAAQHLSGVRTGPGAPAPTTLISAGAVMAAVGALQTVARVNGMDPRRFSWMHGSIARRMRNLRAIVGIPAAELPIDRTVGRIKAVCGVVLLAGIAAVVWL